MSGEANWALEAYEENGPAGVQAFSERCSLLDWIAGVDAAMRHAYWQWSDLRGCMMLGRSVLDIALETADLEILSACKPPVANLAYWTWPGWGESARRPTREMMNLGSQAASLNLELARRLEKPPLAVSRALWVVAAHLMQSSLQDAASIFEEAASKAREAEADDDSLMNQCYAWACRRDRALAGGLSDLETRGEDGAFFADQIRTAMKVYDLPYPS